MSKQTKEQMIEKIIEISGISRSTVFRYMAGKQIRKSSLDAILQATEKLSYLEIGNNKKPKEIIVSISPRFNIFKGYAEELAGVLHQAEATGNKIRLNKDIQLDHTGSGVIIIGKSESDETEEVKLLKEQKIPFVLVNRMNQENEISWVSIDNRKAAMEGCIHLLDQGYKRIGHWGSVEGMVNQDKWKGYNNAHQNRGIKADPSLFFDSEKIPLEEAFALAVELKDGVDSWLADDDETGIKIIRLAVNAGFNIPENFGVCGMNDIGSAEDVIPSLTSVHVPFKEMGMAAVTVLLELMNNPLSLSTKKILHHKLIIRDSSRRIL